MKDLSLQSGTFRCILVIYVENPLDKEPDGVPLPFQMKIKAVCNAVWSADVKNAWKAKLIADKSIL